MYIPFLPTLGFEQSFSSVILFCFCNLLYVMRRGQGRVGGQRGKGRRWPRGSGGIASGAGEGNKDVAERNRLAHVLFAEQAWCTGLGGVRFFFEKKCWQVGELRRKIVPSLTPSIGLVSCGSDSKF
ncbi:hypothetical protein GQ55_2G461700 [Panicum hallii var. hallii]|uniref:Uncharacterized protein n=2 Tax=Panicum hallii TaxID=206008 RepID=A0A2T7EZM4_9POAL|nr:hypothetical protein GQ55_2G461700 [Panicum hallii var. hallii]PVH65362.1 hypothetical protein PAHAL_2G474400 [Panicum hallii]